MALKDETLVIEYKKSLGLTNQDIADIMSCALESGGIAYWCDHVDPVEGHYYGGNACEHIARGGKLIINLTEGPIEKGGPDNYTLTRGKLLNGISQYLSEAGDISNLLYDDGAQELFESSEADADVCDAIVQYALFNEIVFG